LKKGPPEKGLGRKDHSRQYQQPGLKNQKKSYSDLAGIAIIIILGIIIYSNSFTCSFHFDDLSRIVDNPRIRDLANVRSWWNYYPSRPVGIFTFVLNYHFSQLDVRYYHYVNLAIHLINACLVWWLTILIFSSPALKDHPGAKDKKVLAFFTALLFVSHPLATQSVTYIIQRLASMATMFYLLSLALYVKTRLSGKGPASKYLLFAGSFISAVLAMLTKENAFTLPFAIVLFEIFFFQTKKLAVNFRDWRILLLIIASLSVIIIIPLKFSIKIFNPILPSNGNLYTITPLNYLFTQFSVIVKYLQLLFVPVYQNVDYDFTLSDNFFNIRTLASLLLLLSLMVLAVFLFKRYRIIAFGIFWFFITLAIESSFIPINDLIFEHRTYLPSFGFFLALTTGIYFLLWNRYKYVAISVFMIMITTNSILAFERNKVWKDDVSLWSDAVSKSPHKARAILSLGYSYGNLSQWDKAIAEYSRALEINPLYHMAYYNRGVAWDNLEQWDKAITDYSKAIEINPKYLDAYFNRGIAYWNTGQPEKAIDNYTKAIELNPKFTDAWSNRGIAFDKLGQYEKAIADYTKAIEINPKFANAWSNRGVVYGNLGQWEKAIKDYSAAIAIDPKYEAAYYNRGMAYGNLGQWDKAIADYSTVLSMNPNNKDAYNNREMLYLKSGIKK
jgi:protein O-mannosyl-transferase